MVKPRLDERSAERMRAAVEHVGSAMVLVT